jgi:SpoVK/Ycf46/Vps4 family AAA+-type ATPase
VKLEATTVTVEFVVAHLSWETASRLAHEFQSKFAKSDSLFADAYDPAWIVLRKPRHNQGIVGRLLGPGETRLLFRTDHFGGGYCVRIQAALDEFNDHFEVFVMDSAKSLFPPQDKAAEKKKTATDLQSWHKEFGRAFEKLGCRVVRETKLGWKDMVGLDDLRQRLQRSVFQPLAREGLYQKITQRVMPHAVNVLPRGVLLYGPPGCGKTWSMRVIAGEAGLPVVVLPCNAVLTKWYGESENRLASVFAQCREANRMILLIDELDALARHRAESHEATARLVTILLSEMDGIAEATQVLLVGSVNNVDAIDPAVRDRFDLKMEFRLPDREQLRAALAYYARQLTSDDIDELVEQMSGWNFRKIARFAEEVVRTYVSTLDLSRLEAADPPVPLKEDYLAALDGFR